MSDIIQLLPESVANQIAAGEVVQRPASAVKELMENAIDAGANKIQLILKDAGKVLIQVIDNGCGMSVSDARMCFERHATSKVRKAEDLFAIRTMGFRGEAMASIAAIAQVEMKTRRYEDELGTLIEIEGATITKQEPVATPQGTSICIKNLFFNTPARRNFLKSNPAEMRHIIDEFQRVSLANPAISFSLHHDGMEIFRLPSSALKQRIVHLFGNNYNERLIPVEEDTTIINLKGFIGKPQFAKKTRGEQFFFVNNRFIRDNYLNHAINKAYEDLLSDDNFPFYVLFIDIDPAKIDVNVHPTKTEIKYLDEKSIYAIIHSAVKRSLGRFNISPTIDFDQETAFSGMISPKNLDEIIPPSISFNPDFNPFADEKSDKGSGSSGFRGTETGFGGKETGFSGIETGFRSSNGSGHQPVAKNWGSLYEISKEKPAEQVKMELPGNGPDDKYAPIQKQLMQLHNKYIISQIKSGLMLIDQQAAHERILYERFSINLEDRKGASQQSLFPQTVTLSPNDYELAKSLLDDIKSLGFEVREFGKNTLVIEGIPVDLGSNQINETQLFEHLIEGFKNSQQELKLDKRDALARSMAKNSAIKSGVVLGQQEMNMLIEQLFACKAPNFSISGRPVIQTMSLTEIDRKFDK
ncbi:DNA mismatch repair endonuclease MutL [Pedobacter sp. UYP1]|jgi:DNA mismatch repair protein MutL|uniref:DNA mismatch repair endonuclease MutL n=1 Tax=Pedobacter sp. UYP1 TaxID=1756396 RepID=UPI0033954906